MYLMYLVSTVKLLSVDDRYQVASVCKLMLGNLPSNVKDLDFKKLSIVWPAS